MHIQHTHITPAYFGTTVSSSRVITRSFEAIYCTIHYMLSTQILRITCVIYRLLATSSLRTPWRWHSSAGTCLRDKERLYYCVCCCIHLVGLVNKINTEIWKYYFILRLFDISVCEIDQMCSSQFVHTYWLRNPTFVISNFRRVLYVVCFLLGNSPTSEFYMPTFRNTLFHLHRHVGTCLWIWNRQSVPKRRHIKFRRRGITQKKTYKICFYVPIFKTACFFVKVFMTNSV